MKPYWLVLATLVALSPSAHAEMSGATMLYKIGADHFDFEGRITFSGSDATQLRQSIDKNYGNGDGTVARSEAERYEQANTRTFTRNDPECFEDFQLLRIDGKGPLRLSSYGRRALGAEGPTSSQASFDHLNLNRFEYAAPGGDRSTVSMNVDHERNNLATSMHCYFGAGGPGSDIEPPTFTLLVHPASGAKILKDSIRPVEAQAFWDGQGLRYDSGGPEWADTITFTLETPGGFWDGMGPWTWVGVAAMVGAAGIAWFFTEIGRYKFLRLLFLLPGFTRVEKDEVLENSKREELYNFIKTNQGPSFSDLRRALELSNGTLIHHLRILEGQEFITARRDGFRTRFYVYGPKIVATSYLTRTQQELLDVIRASPGITQKELAARLGLPRQNLTYHTKQLAARGALEIRQDGNRRMYWLRPNAAPARPGGAPRQP